MKLHDKINVSIVIVSMNNPLDLIRCVNSIRTHVSSISFDINIVLFNYSDKNLCLIESSIYDCNLFYSTGIVGFSENNNIALKSVTGEFVLILNDDTYFIDNTIKTLFIESKNNNLKISSPVLYSFNGGIQFKGRPKFTVFAFLLHELKLNSYLKNVYKEKKNYFLTYNISGACFLIERNFFEKIGWFDEDYFFTPEDIAISTISRIKYDIYPAVFPKLSVYHKGSSSAKSILESTMPVAKQGVFLFYRKFFGFKIEFISRVFIYPILIFKYIFWFFNFKNLQKRKIMLKSYKKCILLNFSSINTKNLFKSLYSK